MGRIEDYGRLQPLAIATAAMDCADADEFLQLLNERAEEIKGIHRRHGWPKVAPIQYLGYAAAQVVHSTDPLIPSIDLAPIGKPGTSVDEVNDRVEAFITELAPVHGFADPFATN